MNAKDKLISEIEYLISSDQYKELLILELNVDQSVTRAPNEKIEEILFDLLESAKDADFPIELLQTVIDNYKNPIDEQDLPELIKKVEAGDYEALDGLIVIEAVNDEQR